MLPRMLECHLADSSLFWDYERGYSCDINGNAKRETVACAPAEQDTEAYGTAPFILLGVLDELKAENEAKRARLDAIEQAHHSGQHTVAEGLPPEQTVREDILADLPPNHSARSGDVIGRMSFTEPKPWRRL